jgi:hypothetical protein
MLADIRKLKADCTHALDSFPFDFYLRFDFLDSAERAGKLLFDLHCYQEALPHLQYASNWGVGRSTRLLADMYRTGSGVPQDEAKAKALDEQASGQTMKRFTIPADFEGERSPFYIYVREWPAEYPFEGIDGQVQWLKNARDGKIDAAIPTCVLTPLRRRSNDLPSENAHQ